MHYDSSGIGIIHTIAARATVNKNMEFTARLKSKDEIKIKVRGITKRFPPSKDWMIIKIICYEVKEGLYIEAYHAKPYDVPNLLSAKTYKLPRANKPITLQATKEVDIAYLTCYEIMPPEDVKPENKPPVIAGPLSYVFEPGIAARILQTCSDPDGNITRILWDGLENIPDAITSPDMMHLSFNTPKEETEFKLTIVVTDSGGATVSKDIPVAIRKAATHPVEAQG